MSTTADRTQNSSLITRMQKCRLVGKYVIGGLNALVLMSFSATAAPSGEPDYSAALSKLADLGLPDMKGAEWVKVSQQQLQMNLSGSYELERMGIKFKGGGWKLGSGELLLMGSTKPVDAPAGNQDKAGGNGGAIGSALQTMMKNYKKQNPDKTAKQPSPEKKKSLIEQDVEMLTTQLRTPKNSEQIRDSMRYGGFNTGGPILLFAAQTHAAGYSPEASRMVDALFAAAGDRGALIDQAVGAIANTRYQEISTAFFEDYDWKLYLAGVEALQRDFPRGWDGRYAMAMLADKIKPRVEGTPLPTPSIKGVELSQKGLELVAAWCKPPQKPDLKDLKGLDLPNGMKLEDIPVEHRAALLAQLSGGSGWQYDSSPWILSDDSEEPSEQPKHPIKAVKALGMDGLIVLAALVDDQTLTYFSNGNNHGRVYSRSNGSLAERIENYKRSMNRPLTRGEIAFILLAQVVPSNGENDSFSRQEVNPQMLAASAVDFWKDHHKSSQLELCKVYIDRGSQQQRTQAAQLLATSKDAAAARVFEEVVLSSSNLIAMNQVVASYIQTKKVKAQSFYNAYAKRMTDLYGQMTEDQLQQLPGGWELSRAGVDGYLKKLAVHVGSGSVKELLADALNAENKDDQHWWRMIQSFSQMPKSDVLIAVADVLPKAQQADQAWLFQIAMSVQGEDEPNEAALKAWGGLLENDQLMGESSALGWLDFFGLNKTNEIAAVVLELNYNQAATEAMRIHYSATTGPMGELLIKRAHARLKGEAPPPFINADEVSDERRAEIEKLAEETSDVIKLREKISALKPSERAAWLDWYFRIAMNRMGSANESSAPEVILKARNTIVSIQCDLDKKLIQELDLKVGSQLEPKELEAISALLLKRYGKEVSTHFAASITRVGLGLDLVISQPVPQTALQAISDSWLFRNLGSAADAYATAGFGLGQADSMWRLDGDKVGIVDDGRGGELVRVIESYKQFIESKRIYTAPIYISVLSHKEYLKHRADN